VERTESKFNLNFTCNNNCVFCCANKKEEKCDSLKRIKKNIESFARKGGDNRLIISGGEPLISEDLFDLLTFAKRKGIKKIGIQTNGRMLCYEEMVRKLKEFEPIDFLVSFHFPNARLYKKYCRSDGFQQTVEGIKNLVKYNCDVRTNTVVMKQNLPYLKGMMKFLKRLGVKQYEYYFIIGKNLGKNYRKFVPRYEKCTPAIEKIIEENKGISISLKGFPACVIKEELRKRLIHYLTPIRTKTLGKPPLAKYTFPNCQDCIFRSARAGSSLHLKIANKLSCPGVKEEYVKNYGTKEFKPIYQ
jgi:uncharacterized protein